MQLFKRRKQKKNIQPRYRSLRCDQMTEEDIQATIDLFGNHYGIWAANDNPKRQAGQNIKMNFIKSAIVDKPDRFIAMAYDEDRLIGYAYYMRRETPAGEMVTWILQLVVDKEYRGQNIGTKIMHAIWGMSDSWAWGLYTSNPFTIKCLQDATMRKVKKKTIETHLNELKTVAYDLLPDLEWIDTYKNGIVDTKFPIDFTKAVEDFRVKFPQEKFDLDDRLEIGHEWLAFVFSDQKARPTNQQIQKFLDFSEEVTRDAYSKMEMEKQGWASHTDEEVDFVIREALQPKSILDIGCGHGRHSVRFAEKGIETTGIDYVRIKQKEQENLHFEYADARYVELGESYDAVIALYDVVGSYSNELDNLKILNTAYRHLKQSGKLIISVMNMSLTMDEVRKHKNLISGIRKQRNVIKLIELKGSRTMQTTGQVFNGRYILIDTETGECFRREQFFCEDALPIDYVVVDRRYTETGIKKLVEAAGFVVEDCYCVQAGRFDKRLPSNDLKAKEILVIAKKGTWFQKYFGKHNIDGCWK